LPICQPPIVEHLKQDVEDVRVRLLDLVEEDHLVGPPAHGFRQRAALVIADIAGRRPDQPGDGMLLHVFRHIHAHHGGLVVKEVVGERLGELSLADAGGPEEHERADRSVRVLQAGAGAAHRSRDGAHGFSLADNTAAKFILHAKQLVALAFQHLVDRDAGPARDNPGDMVGRDGFLHQVAGAFLGRFRFPQLPLQTGDHAIGELASLGEVAAALRRFQIEAGSVELLLEL
jgi:hypothetical protein